MDAKLTFRILLVLSTGAAASMLPLVPPKLIPLSRAAHLRKGERWHVTCSASDGTTPLNFQWTKDGTRVEQQQGEAGTNPEVPVVRRLDDFSTSLMVESVGESHSGNYTCSVENAAGRDSGTTSLEVQFPPHWIRPPSDTSVLAGSKIVLICDAKGSPPPTITWKRNTDFSAMSFEVVHSDGHLRITNEGQSLKIPEAKKEDEGFYECHVTNGIGDPLRKSIRVEVQVPPKVAPGPTEVVVKRGRDVSLSCNVTGDSPLHIVWEKNGRTLESRKPKIRTHEFPVGDGVTTLLEMSHAERDSSGLYVCRARNSYGESYRMINIDVVEIPGQPKDLSVAQVWSRSLQLTWEAPYHGNRPILGYTVRFWKTEGKSEPPSEKPEQLLVPSLQTGAVVPGLLPNTHYSLQLTAENEVGAGPTSERVSATTRDEEPDWAPSDLVVVDKHATSATLKWKCPHRSEWSSPLLGYYIGYKKMSGKTTFSYRTLGASTPCKRGGQEEFVLRGLQRASSYYVVVRAYNRVGSGPPSEQVVLHTADGGPPRTPHVKVLQTGGVIVTLRITPRENSRSLPTAYLVSVSEESGDQHKIFVPVHSSGNYSVGGLRPGKQYQVTAVARNRFGESSVSERLKIVTDHTDPSLSEPSGDPVYEKAYFVLPIVLSAAAIVVLPLVACYCHKLNTSPIQTELIEDRDFLYAAATLRRLETMRRASATLSARPVPARTSSLPRQPRSSRATTTTLPEPEPIPVPSPEPSPALPTSYSTLQNYGTANADDPLAAAVASPPADPAASRAPPEDSRYDSVVEEMRTFIKDKGCTRPKKIEAVFDKPNATSSSRPLTPVRQTPSTPVRQMAPSTSQQEVEVMVDLGDSSSNDS